MKKVLVVALMAGIIPSLVQAAGNHPMAGCGLAYMLFAQDNSSKGMQILASTTNNSYGTQSFGITSGTSGCTDSGALSRSMETEVYAEVNLKELSREMALGSGEYLSAFSSLLGIASEQQEVFFSFVQAKYDVLFPTAKTTSVEMLNSLYQELSNRRDLLG